MNPLFVSYHFLSYSGEKHAGDCIIEWNTKLSTADDLDSLKAAIIEQERLQCKGLIVYFWRRVE